MTFEEFKDAVAKLAHSLPDTISLHNQLPGVKSMHPGKLDKKLETVAFKLAKQFVPTLVSKLEDQYKKDYAIDIQPKMKSQIKGKLLNKFSTLQTSKKNQAILTYSSESNSDQKGDFE